MPFKQLPRPSFPRRSRLRLKPVVAALIALPLLPGVAFGQLTGAAAQPVPLDPGWGFSMAPQIEEHVLPAGQRGATFPLGDAAQGNLNRDITLDGNAEIRRSTSVLKGDRLHYDQDSDVVDGYGHVRVIDSGNLFHGPRAQLEVGATEGYMLSPTYHFGLTGGSGQAQRIEIIDDERVRVLHGTYTACQCDSAASADKPADASDANGAAPAAKPKDPVWYLRASQIDLDSGDNTGVARNAVMYFKGVPLFASPYISFPLNDARKTGLLPPTVSVSSSTGLDIMAPYYLNLAPNRDLLLTPRIMARRGVQLSTNFRYMSPTYSGTFTLEELPHDDITKTNRYAIYAQHTQDLGNGFGAYVNYNRVSDNTYPEDLTSVDTFTLGTQTLYQQEAGLTYNNGPWSVLTRIQRWQTLPPSTAPYEREPELNVKYTQYDVGGFDFGAEADYTRFKITTADQIQGDRVYLNPYISYPLIGPGYFIIPKLQYHLAAYNLSTIPADVANQPRNLSVAIPTFSLDTGLIFERQVTLFGASYIQTLEPRVYYVNTPYRNQSQIPVFDTAESDFGLAEIFTPNTFVGNDRVADGERLTAALTTRFINPATGDERARFLLAQQYYIRAQQTTIPNETLTDSTRSDVLLGASLKLGSSFATQNAIQYNPDSRQLIRSNVGFAWSPAERSVINIAYRYTRSGTTVDQTSVRQAVMSFEWPFTSRFYGVGRINYALDAHRLVDGLIGLQYDAPCWAFGLAIQHYANGVDLSQSTSTGVRYLAQFELKGFARVDNGLAAAFIAGVPGYAPPPPPPPPLSRFSNYE